MVASGDKAKVSSKRTPKSVGVVKKTPEADKADEQLVQQTQIQDTSQQSLVVDDRVLPDSGLPTDYVEGVLDIAHEGSGLLRPNFHPSENDIYISSSQIR